MTVSMRPSSRLRDYEGRTVWILGASSGIGAALARELAGRGARLVLSARRKEALVALNAELGGVHVVLPLDVTDASALRHAASALGRDLPALDSAVFMAALYSPHDKTHKDIDFVHEMLRVNLGGAFNMVHAVLPVFEAQGRGQIALCASVAGYRGLPYGQPYCAAKAALINLAESLKIELEDRRIDVKVINPGFVRTPLTDKNDFPMPMMIEAPAAAKYIARGLNSRAFEIHFPPKFTLLMKIMRALPASLYFALARFLRARV